MILRIAKIVVIFSALLAATPGMSQDSIETDIKPQALDDALKQFANRADLQLIYPTGLVDGLQSKGTDKPVGNKDALDQLLAQTGLTHRFVNDRTVAIERRIKDEPSGTNKVPVQQEKAPLKEETDKDVKQSKSVSNSAHNWEEIVVTGTRRNESLFDTPSAITAFGEKFLENRSIDSIDDLVSLTPGLAADVAGLTGRGRDFTIRGVQGQNLTGATVGIYLDDVPQTFSGGGNEPNIRTFDLQRIEVLRGPQGTLFGAGAMGGAIRYISNKPDSSEFQGRVRLEGSSIKEGGENYAFDGVLNAPLVKDELALRVAVSEEKRGGVVDLLTAIGGPFEDSNINDLTSVRGVLRWTPTEAMTIDLQVWHQKTSFEGLDVVNTGSSSPFVDDVESGPLSFGNNDFNQYAGTVSYDFGWAEMVSTSSWIKTDDFSEFTDGFAGDSITQITPFEAFSHETRLVSAGDGPLSWIAGVFYQNAESIGGVFNLNAFGATATSDLERKQISVFGEVGYQLTEKLEAIVGFRYFNEDVIESSEAVFFGVPSASNGDAAYNATLPKFLLNYKFSDNLNLYTSVSEGFRVGGANLVVSPMDPPQFEPDSVWAYEGGAKFISQNGGVSGGIAVFYNDWSDIQVFTPAPSGFTNLVTNAGEASVLGFEAEISVMLRDGLVLGANTSIMAAEFDESATVVGGTIEPGYRINDIPETSLALFLDYTTEIKDGVDFSLHLDGAYRGNEVALDQSSNAESSSIWNVRTSLTFNDVELGFFVRNLLNGDTIRKFNNFYFGAPRPRTVGFELLIDF